MRNGKLLLLVMISFLFLLSNRPPARADIIIMVDGRSLEGEILSQNRREITIKTKAGITVTVDRDDVEKIVTKADLKKEYNKKLSAIKDKDDEYARMALAEWCKKNGLKDEYKIELKEVLRINPDNAEAKRELDLLEGRMPEGSDDEEEPMRTTPRVKKKSDTGDDGEKSSGKKVIVKKNILGGPKGNPDKTDESKKKLKKALAFLASKQTKGGWWPIKMSHVNGTVLVSSIGGLAFMADGSSPSKGPYSLQVGRSLKYVRNAITAPDRMGSRSSGKGNWNQSNWRWGMGGIFLAECYTCHKDPSLKAKIQEVVRLLEGSQEESGGWGHGPGGPNALGYVELEVMSNLAMTALGLAKRIGCKINEEKFQKGIDYIVKCTNKKGGVGYSTRKGQIGGGCPGRTGGALMAFSACEYDKPICQLMSDYMEEKMEEIPEGHASPALHFLQAGLGSLNAHADVWNIFIEKLYPVIYEKMQSDGSFQHITNKEGDKDENNGVCYTSVVFTLMLAADKGYLNYLGGVFSKSGTGIHVKSKKQRIEDRKKAIEEREKARQEALRKAQEEANKPDPATPAEKDEEKQEESK
ncbi:MAG: DUF6288 domain-containing protein [Planctomycetota bacterium]|jgi:hypothetical protein